MPRHELKFFVSTRDALALKDKLGRVLRPDSHAGAYGEYRIRSLYFDDAYDTAYHDKLDGVMHRDKYRIRLYNQDESAIRLERKRKMGDLIDKSSAYITRRLADQLMSGDPAGLEKLNHPLLQDLYVQMRLHRLRPAVIVDYDRAAFLHPAENVRITFDRDVRTFPGSLDPFSTDAPAVRVLTPGKVVLEVKYDRYLPDYLTSVLSSIPAERSAISKYTLCRQYTL